MDQLAPMVISRQQPSQHRRLILKIAKLLSKEDIDEIVYLTEEFVSPSEAEKLSSGVDLMRCLERHGRLGPGRYHYLLSCLKEVGRIDLATTLSQSMECPLPHLPASFSVSSQTHRLKLGILEAKQMKYAQHMRHLSALSRDQVFWEKEWKEIFQSLCQDFVREDDSSLPGRGDVDKVFAEILDDIKAGTLSIITAFNVLKDVTCMSIAAQHISAVLKRYEKIRTELEGISWKKNRCSKYMGHVYLASEACSFLGEFLTELLGQKAICVEAKSLSEQLTSMAIIVNIAQYGLVVLQWLFTATDVIVSSSVGAEKYKPQLLEVNTYLTQEDIHKHNHDLYQQILQGTKVAKVREADGILTVPDTNSVSLNTSPSTSIVPFCPVLVTLCLNTFVLIHVSELAPGDWGMIKANYRLAESRFAQLYSVSAGGLFQILCSIVDSFKRNILSAVLDQATGLQDVITELLSYSSN